MKHNYHYEKAPEDEYWFCTVHHRRATHLLFRQGMEPEHVCDPEKGGILMPCIAEKKTKPTQWYGGPQCV